MSLYFDHASTTACSPLAAALLQKYSVEEYGNPASSHALGVAPAKAIREARRFFAQHFQVQPEQVVFTGSGSEADNMAIYGIALPAILAARAAGANGAKLPRVLASATEHPAVRKTVQSLTALGAEAILIPVDRHGQINRDRYLELLTPETVLVSIHQVNNIVGALHPVEELSRIAKDRVPGVVFHTDAIQAFGRTALPHAPSAIDLISVSAHKVHGPKGVGALISLNPKLLKSAAFRPLIWGGDQEGGLRSGTQSAGLIAGFAAGAQEVLGQQAETAAYAAELRSQFKSLLEQKGLLSKNGLQWNSPESPMFAVPHIVNLSIPGYPSGPLAKLLEERGCSISTGSACSSQKAEPDAVLTAMGLPATHTSSAIRVTFSAENLPEDVVTLVDALDESIGRMRELLGGGASR